MTKYAKGCVYCRKYEERGLPPSDHVHVRPRKKETGAMTKIQRAPSDPAAPKSPHDLTKVELASIVQSLQEFLYGELDERGEKVVRWNPDKEIGGADFVEFACATMGEFGLAPK